ncbi:DUF6415 family natural product biosynthesis protein [Streptomyces sp. cg28]|uniref:DUF6415 family natural product biosynthesis protein n=1 Tax=Streptomyces sp. cg28 TaxID=3403457 RepID=UPI003B21413F
MPTIQNPAPETAEKLPLPDLMKAALGATRERPDETVRARLNLQLRTEIGRLLPLVQAQMDAITPRTRAWYARDAAIDLAKDELAKQIGPSPTAAGLSLASLARSLHTLDEFAGGES